jgi:hypothetical protein
MLFLEIEGVRPASNGAEANVRCLARFRTVVLLAGTDGLASTSKPAPRPNKPQQLSRSGLSAMAKGLAHTRVMRDAGVRLRTIEAAQSLGRMA